MIIRKIKWKLFKSCQPLVHYSLSANRPGDLKECFNAMPYITNSPVSGNSICLVNTALGIDWSMDHSESKRTIGPCKLFD